jgi:hypothetical protein
LYGLEAGQLATEHAEIDAGVVGDEHLVAQRVAQFCLDVGNSRSVCELVGGDPVDASRHRSDRPRRLNQPAPRMANQAVLDPNNRDLG